MPTRTSWPLIQTVFVLSGAAALGYEIVWGRWLGTVLGASTMAACVVLCCYMGGLAAGAAFFGKLSARTAAPMLAYAAVEIQIAVLALLFPTFAAALLGLPGWMRTGAAVVVLLMPTFLMGGTLPLVIAWTEQAGLPEGRALGRLYGLNTLGAAGGCLVAGFALIPAAGLEATNALAAGANTLVAIVAYAIYRTARGAKATAAPERAAPVAAAPWHAASLLLLAFLSGLVALGLEILWIRELRIVLGSTTYTLTLVIATCILGLGAGGLWAGRVPEHAPVRRPLAEAQLLLLVVLALGFLALPRTPELVGRLRFAGDPWTGSLVSTALLCALLLLPATALQGYLFPLLGRLYMERGPRGRAVGHLYAVNTIGAVLGSLLATVVLIPLAGSAATYALFLALMAVSLLVYARFAGRGLRASFWLPAGLAIALVGLCAARRPGWTPANLGYGIGWTTMDPRTKILFFAEGRASTVLVERFLGGLTMRVDGKPVASTFYQDRANELMLGHLPALLTPRVRRGLVVGLGTAITLDALAQHELERLDAVELEPLVATGARFFAEDNRRVLERPELRLTFDDGFNYLHASDAEYDVITSDPIQPFFRGAATLYSADYFARARQRLARSGVMAAWLPLGNLGRGDFALVVRSFAEVFPYARIYWTGGGPDAVLVGRQIPWEEPAIVAAQYRYAADDLRSVYIDSAEEAAALLVADRDVMLGWAGPGPLTTVDRPRLEFSAPASLYADTIAQNLYELLQMRQTVRETGSLWRAVSIVLGYKAQIQGARDDELARQFFARTVPCGHDWRCALADRSGLLRRLLWRRAIAEGDRALARYADAHALAGGWWYSFTWPAGPGCESADIERGLAAYRAALRLSSPAVASERQRIGRRVAQVLAVLPRRCPQREDFAALAAEAMP
ncbi:MAG: fused MFS/spermidine synthase [Deltaproteobacteria bacterium]|nr:fused MFS/spermidine synthase [Deltaproteobacteria bacterium]